MTFMESIQTCFSKFFVIEGRASRSEFWWFYLYYIVVTLTADRLAGDVVNTRWVIVNLLWLCVAIPSTTAGIRRMHDVDRSGWFILVPIYNLILSCTAGTPGPNRFGSSPIESVDENSNIRV